jgi:hypothetical protein
VRLSVREVNREPASEDESGEELPRIPTDRRSTANVNNVNNTR